MDEADGSAAAAERLLVTLRLRLRALLPRRSARPAGIVSAVARPTATALGCGGEGHQERAEATTQAAVRAATGATAADTLARAAVLGRDGYDQDVRMRRSAAGRNRHRDGDPMGLPDLRVGTASHGGGN